eukprot:2915807-Pyramimonas_sp.AAC.1
MMLPQQQQQPSGQTFGRVDLLDDGADPFNLFGEMLADWEGGGQAPAGMGAVTPTAGTLKWVDNSSIVCIEAPVNTVPSSCHLQNKEMYPALAVGIDTDIWRP